MFWCDKTTPPESVEKWKRDSILQFWEAEDNSELDQLE